MGKAIGKAVSSISRSSTRVRSSSIGRTQIISETGAGAGGAVGGAGTGGAPIVTGAGAGMGGAAATGGAGGAAASGGAGAETVNTEAIIHGISRTRTFGGGRGRARARDRSSNRNNREQENPDEINTFSINTAAAVPNINVMPPPQAKNKVFTFSLSKQLTKQSFRKILKVTAGTAAGIGLTSVTICLIESNNYVKVLLMKIEYLENGKIKIELSRPAADKKDMADILDPDEIQKEIEEEEKELEAERRLKIKLEVRKDFEKRQQEKKDAKKKKEENDSFENSKTTQMISDYTP